MLQAIRRYFSEQLRTESAGTDPEHTRRLATAALMVEALRADDQIEARERETALAGLTELFDLSSESAKELFALAEQEADEGTSLFQFTYLIDRHYSREEKFRVIEMLWQVAYADGHKHAQEEHLVRKVADLLHLPHSEFIRARLRVEEATRER